MASYNGPANREDPYLNNSGLVGTKQLTIGNQLQEVLKLVGQIEGNLGCPFGGNELQPTPSSGRLDDYLNDLAKVIERLARIEEQTKLLG